MIKNHKKENINPSSYDFQLGEIFKHEKIDLVDLEKEKTPKVKALELPYVIKPGEYLIGRTIEELDTPQEIMSFYATKSVALRIGLNIICGINDPGYKGKAVFGIHNVSKNKIRLFKGMKLLQIAFTELKGNTIPLETKYMGGKVL